MNNQKPINRLTKIILNSENLIKEGYYDIKDVSEISKIKRNTMSELIGISTML